MRSISRWGVVAGAAAMTVAGTVAPAAGAADQAVPTFQGNIVEGTAENCEQTDDVSGRYSVTLKKDGTASVSLTMFMDGQIHAAWGGNAFGARWTWEATDTGYLLSLFDLTMTIEGDTMRFVIPDRYEGCDGYVLATVR
ncbi:MAG TPA: hypothetical protein VFZ64_18070 [Nocardioidaceae bacterium]